MQNIIEREWEEQMHTALHMRREFGAAERRYLLKWYEMDFDIQTIKQAYSHTCIRTGGLNWAYMDSILQRWYESAQEKTVAQLRYDPATDRLDFDGDSLHCGQCLEVLVVDGISGQTKWVETRLEYGDGWYLVGLVGYQVNGLFARM